MRTKRGKEIELEGLLRRQELRGDYLAVVDAQLRGRVDNQLEDLNMVVFALPVVCHVERQREVVGVHSQPELFAQLAQSSVAKRLALADVTAWQRGVRNVRVANRYDASVVPNGYQGAVRQRVSDTPVQPHHLVRAAVRGPIDGI